jgi:hypothetical protein
LTTETLKTETRGAKLILAVTVGTLLVLTPVAFLVSGSVGVYAVLISSLVCAGPGLVTLAFSKSWAQSSAGLLLVSFARMGMGLLVAVVTKVNWPDLTFTDFYLWLAIVYMASLAVDTVAVQQSIGSGNRKGSADVR